MSKWIQMYLRGLFWQFALLASTFIPPCFHLWECRPNAKLRNNPHKTAALTSDTNLSPRGFPKPPSILIIHEKDSQNPLVTIILWLHFITGKRYRLKIAKEETHRAEPSRGPNVSLQVSSPHESWTMLPPFGHVVWQHTENIATQGNSLKPQCPEIHLGLDHITTHMLTTSLQSLLGENWYHCLHRKPPL